MGAYNSGLKVKNKLLTQIGPRLGLVAGFYNESLTRDLVMRKSMRPALYIDVDVDLYSS